MLCGGSVGLAAAIAGCTGALGGGDGGPEYEEGDKEGMGATVDAFPDGWQRDDTFNENFDRVFVNGDETIIVLTHIELFESVSDAEEGFDQSRSGFRDPQEYDIADDAFWDTQNDEMAVTMFRLSTPHKLAVDSVFASSNT